MQYGQEFDYMGTQFYQNDFNYWWEPHSNLNQSQNGQVVEQQIIPRKDTTDDDFFSG